MAGGSSPQPVMLRGIAVQHEVDPVLHLMQPNGSGWKSVAFNDEWELDVNAGSVSALAPSLQLPDKYGNDAGMLVYLNPGTYSAHLSSSAGQGLAVMGVDTVADAALFNMSGRAYLGGGVNDLFAGFVVRGSGMLPVMLRGIALDAGVNPVLTVLERDTSGWRAVAVNDDWKTDNNAAAIRALPFHLQLPDRNKNDAGLLLELPAGVYGLYLTSAWKPGLAVIGVDALE